MVRPVVRDNICDRGGHSLSIHRVNKSLLVRIFWVCKYIYRHRLGKHLAYLLMLIHTYISDFILYKYNDIYMIYLSYVCNTMHLSKLSE